MKRNCYIRFIIIVFFFKSITAYAQFLDKKQYLIDSLQLSSLTQEDKQLIDGILTNYHAAKSDTLKLQLLDSLSNNLINEDIALRYTQQLVIISNVYTTKSENKIALKYQGLAYKNIGTLLFSKGEKWDIVFSYYSKSISIFQTIHYKYGLALAYHELALLYGQKGSIKEAMAYHYNMQQVLDTAVYKQEYAVMLRNMGALYSDWGNYHLAIDCLYKSLRILEKYDTKNDVGVASLGLANTYYRLGKIKDALTYYKKALLIFESTKDASSAINAYIGIGHVFEKEGRLETALMYYEKSNIAAKQTKNNIGQTDALKNIGNIYFSKKDYEKATSFYTESYTISKQYDLTSRQIYPLLGLSKIYLQKNNYNAAIEKSSKALEIARELNSPIYISEASQLLFSVYKKQGNINKALEFHELYVTMRDSVNNDIVRKQVVENQVKYDYEKKTQADSIRYVEEQKIKNAQLGEQQAKITQQQQRIYFIVALALLVILITVLIFRQQKIKEQQTNLQLEQKLLRAQMNPHFIFNVLGSIRSFIQKNDARQADRYLTKFSKLTRTILEYSRTEYVPIEKEIATIKDYLDLQLLLMDNAFDYSIHIDESIDQEHMLIPPMLIQPFAENSVKHGFSQNTEDNKGHITIRCSLSENKQYLVLELADNGIGFKKTVQAKNTDHISLATTITNERLANLNKLKSRKITLRIVDIAEQSLDKQGTCVIFEIPLEQNM